MGLDVNNLPKYCPQCAKSDTQSKVKVFRMKDGTSMIMCKNSKCPWPFSEYSREEVTFPSAQAPKSKKSEDVSTASDASKDSVVVNATPNKRKETSSVNSLDKDRSSEKQVDLQEFSPSKERQQAEVFLVDIHEVVHAKEGKSQEAFGKRKLPQDSRNVHKKPKIGVTDVSETEPASIFSIAPEPAPEADPLDSLVSSSVSTLNEQDVIPGPSNVVVSPSPALTEAEIFKAMPVALRKPLRLPKHAVHILDSRVTDGDILEETEMGASMMDSVDAEDQDDSELDGSDSELEELVSNCSTMTQISGQSLDAEGKGKVKRRGKKKKRKDRRKQHSQKCSKNQHRTTDIGGAFSPQDEDEENSSDEEIRPDIQFPCGEVDTEDISIEENRIGEDINKSPSQANNETNKTLEQGSEEETMLFEEMVPVSILPSSQHLENEDENDASMISIESGVFDEVVLSNKRPMKREIIARSQDSIQSDESIESVIYREPDIIVYCMEKNKDESYPGEGDTCIGIKYEDPRTGWNVVCPPFCIEKRHIEELILIIRRSLDTVRCKAYKKKIDKPDNSIAVAKARVGKVVSELIRKYFTIKWLDEESKRQDEQNIEKVFTTSNISLELPAREKLKEISESEDQIMDDFNSEEFTDAVMEIVDPNLAFKKPLAPEEKVNQASPKLKKELIRKVQGDPEKKNLFFNLESMIDPLSPMPSTPGTDLDQSLPSPQSFSLNKSHESDSILPDSVSNDDEAENYSMVDENIDSIMTSPGDKNTQVKAEPKKNIAALRNISSLHDIKYIFKSLPSLSNRLVLKTGIPGITIKTANVRTIEHTMRPVRCIPTEADWKRMRNNPALNNLDKERNDPELSQVWKLAAGSSSPPRMENKLEYTEPTSDVTSSKTVFHVSQHHTIDLPQQMHTLEITERGSNKVFLTSQSESVEAKDLIPDDIERLPNPRRRYNKKVEFGDGWFVWRKHNVDESLCEKYNDFIQELVAKHETEPLKALIKEKELSTDVKDVIFCIGFYQIVLSKINILVENYNLLVDDAIDFVRSRLKLKRDEFTKLCKEVFEGTYIEPANMKLHDYLSKETLKKLERPTVPRHDVTQHLSQDLIDKMIRIKGLNIKTLPEDSMPQDLTIKQEPSDPYASYGTSVSIVDPASVDVVNEADVIGEGNMCIQFFYEDPNTGSKVAFKPVYVRDEEDIKCVMALCNERAAEFKYRYGQIKKPVRYYSEVVRAKTQLSPAVVKYIKACFTKQGMKHNRIDYQKKEVPRAQPFYDFEVAGVKKEKKHTIANVMPLSSEDEDDPVDSDTEIEEFDPAPHHQLAAVTVLKKRVPFKPRAPQQNLTDDSERVLEERVLGIVLPKIKGDEKIFTKKRKQAYKAQDGRSKDNPLTCKMYNLNQILDSNNHKGRRSNETLKLNSLIKTKRKKPRKVESDSSSDTDLDDSDLFLDDLYRSKESGNTRKSARIKEKFVLFADEDANEDNPDDPPSVSDTSQFDVVEITPLQPSPRRVINPPSPTRRVTFSDTEMTNSEKSLTAAAITTSQINSMRPVSRTSSKNPVYSPVTSPNIIERALSALSERSSSQSSNRPDSQLGENSSRPGSRNTSQDRPKSRNKKIDGKSVGVIEDSEVDAPVFTPRRRQEERNISRPPSQADIDNYEAAAELESAKKKPDDSVTKVASTDINKFDQKYIRTSKKARVEKMLAKQKRKAEKNEKKKLLGFGQKKEDVNLDELKKPNKPSNIKKAQVSKEESDLVMSLLFEAEMAVSSQKNSSQQVASSSRVAASSSTNIVSTQMASTSTKEIMQFEEYNCIVNETETNTDIDDLLNTL